MRINKKIGQILSWLLVAALAMVYMPQRIAKAEGEATVYSIWANFTDEGPKDLVFAAANASAGDMGGKGLFAFYITGGTYTIPSTDPPTMYYINNANVSCSGDFIDYVMVGTSSVQFANHTESVAAPPYGGTVSIGDGVSNEFLGAFDRENAPLYDYTVTSTTCECGGGDYNKLIVPSGSTLTISGGDWYDEEHEETFYFSAFMHVNEAEINGSVVINDINPSWTENPNPNVFAVGQKLTVGSSASITGNGHGMLELGDNVNVTGLTLYNRDGETFTEVTDFTHVEQYEYDGDNSKWVRIPPNAGEGEPSGRAQINIIGEKVAGVFAVNFPEGGGEPTVGASIANGGEIELPPFTDEGGIKKYSCDFYVTLSDSQYKPVIWVDGNKKSDIEGNLETINDIEYYHFIFDTESDRPIIDVGTEQAYGQAILEDKGANVTGVFGVAINGDGEPLPDEGHEIRINDSVVTVFDSGSNKYFCEFYVAIADDHYLPQIFIDGREEEFCHIEEPQRRNDIDYYHVHFDIDKSNIRINVDTKNRPAGGPDNGGEGGEGSEGGEGGNNGGNNGEPGFELISYIDSKGYAYGDWDCDGDVDAEDLALGMAYDIYLPQLKDHQNEAEKYGVEIRDNNIIAAVEEFKNHIAVVRNSELDLAVENYEGNIVKLPGYEYTISFTMNAGEPEEETVETNGAVWAFAQEGSTVPLSDSTGLSKVSNTYVIAVAATETDEKLFLRRAGGDNPETTKVVSGDNEDSAIIIVADYSFDEYGYANVMVFGNAVSLDFLLSQEENKKLAAYQGRNEDLIVNTGLPWDCVFSIFTFIQTDYTGVRVKGTDDNIGSTPSWQFASYPVFSTDADASTENEAIVFFGHKEITIEPINTLASLGIDKKIVGIESISAVDTKITIDAVEFVKVSDVEWKVKFHSDYYDEVEVKVVYKFDDGSQSDYYITIHRVGIDIMAGHHGPGGSMNLMHGTDNGPSYQSDAEYIIWGTYYYPQPSTEKVDLYVTYTWADGSVTKKLISNNSSLNMEYDHDLSGNCQSSDFVLYEGTEAGAPAKIEAIAVVQGFDDDSSFSGAKLGAGRGVTWINYNH